MPYTNSQSPMSLPMGGSRSGELTQEDVERLRKQLQNLGLDGTLLDRANDTRGDLLGQRNALRGQLAESVGLGEMASSSLAGGGTAMGGLAASL